MGRFGAFELGSERSEVQGTFLSGLFVSCGFTEGAHLLRCKFWVDPVRGDGSAEPRPSTVGPPSLSHHPRSAV